MKYRNAKQRLYFAAKLRQKSEISEAKATTQLLQHYYRDKPIMIANNHIQTKYDLMIVVPAYNLEKHIAVCIDSILRQKTRFTYHIVIVDDGSTDGTMSVLAQYATNESITVISQKNGGAAAARNTALRHICGRYVMFVDGDDYLPDHAVEALMETAVEHDADLVQGGYLRFCDDKILETVRITDTVTTIPNTAITGFPCMKVIRAEILRDFCFPEQFLYEDTAIIVLLAPCCQNVYQIPDIVYFYRFRQDSGCNQQYGLRGLDTFWVSKYCLEEANDRGYPFTVHEHDAFLRQCRLNASRIREISKELQECVFVSSAGLLKHYFPYPMKSKDVRIRYLDRALRKNSYKAFTYLLEWWGCF